MVRAFGQESHTSVRNEDVSVQLESPGRADDIVTILLHWTPIILVLTLMFVTADQLKTATQTCTRYDSWNWQIYFYILFTKRVCAL